MTDAVVSASKRIAAKPAEIFAILVNPERHTEFDGSGMLRGADGAGRLAGPGDVFSMRMYHDRFGHYEMINTVVEYEPERLIAWEPARRDGLRNWHYRWR